MLSFVLFLLILLSIQYTPTYVYRLITMNVADVYDYENFENQEIKGAKSTNTFISQPKEKYVESLFEEIVTKTGFNSCLLYTSPSPRDRQKSRMPSSA